MKGKWDDFIEDMVSDNTPSKSDPKSENLNEIGKKMEAAVKKAFESAKNEPKEADPEPAPKQEEPKEAEEPLEGNKED